MELLLLVCLCLLSCSGDGQGLKDRTGEHIQGAASVPSITTLLTPDGMVLQCEVLGASPKPKVEWKDSSGNILPVKDLKETNRGDSYDVSLQTAVTKSGTFRCVVTQEEIKHQVYAETYATFNGAAAGPGSNTGLLMLWFLVFLFLF